MLPVIAGKLFPVTQPAPLDGLLAAGPLSHQPSSMPYRIVLMDRQKVQGVPGFFVTEQGFKLEEGRLYHTGFSGSNYYEPNELVQATEKFADRVKKHASYLESLYREEP